MGGEKFAPLLYHTSEGGSPPRGRGKGIKPCYHRVAMGITPAWAGKSFSFKAPDYSVWDHPRVGGEKQSRAPEPLCSMGSPPRGRGKAGFS